jgi:hypothetical protein
MAPSLPTEFNSTWEPTMKITNVKVTDFKNTGYNGYIVVEVTFKDGTCFTETIDGHEFDEIEMAREVFRLTAYDEEPFYTYGDEDGFAYARENGYVDEDGEMTDLGWDTYKSNHIQMLQDTFDDARGGFEDVLKHLKKVALQSYKANR